MQSTGRRLIFDWMSICSWSPVFLTMYEWGWIQNKLQSRSFTGRRGKGFIGFTWWPIVLAKFSVALYNSMMTWTNGNIFRVTDPLRGEFTAHRWFPRKGQWRGTLMFSLICAWINGWVNNREAGDLRRHRAHYGHCNATTDLVSTGPKHLEKPGC